MPTAHAADQSFLLRRKDQKADKFLTLKILSGRSRLKYEQMVGFPDIASTGSTGRKSQSIWTRFTAAPHLQPALLTAALQGLLSVALQCTVSTRIARRAECKVEVSLERAPGRIFFFFFFIDLVNTIISGRLRCCYWKCCLWTTKQLKILFESLKNDSKAFIFFQWGYKESATDEKVPFTPALVSTTNLFRNAVLLYGLILKTCKAEIV